MTKSRWNFQWSRKSTTESDSWVLLQSRASPKIGSYIFFDVLKSLVTENADFGHIVMIMTTFELWKVLKSSQPFQFGCGIGADEEYILLRTEMIKNLSRRYEHTWPVFVSNIDLFDFVSPIWFTKNFITQYFRGIEMWIAYHYYKMLLFYFSHAVLEHIQNMYSQANFHLNLK